MSTGLIEAPASPPRTRRPAQSRTRPAAPKVKVTLVLDDDVAQRLHIHAAMTRQDRSDLVNGLVRDHLKRFVVQDRSRASDPVTEDRQSIPSN